MHSLRGTGSWENDTPGSLSDELVLWNENFSNQAFYLVLIPVMQCPEFEGCQVVIGNSFSNILWLPVCFNFPAFGLPSSS